MPDLVRVSSQPVGERHDIIDVLAENLLERIILPSPDQLRLRFIKWMDKKKHNPRVRERLLRLNPDPQEGQRIRGWHPAPTLEGLWMERNVMGKREFIKKHGREALKAMPKHCFWRQGRRSYILTEAVEDQAWKWVKQ